MTTVYKAWCEWDIGEDGYAYASREVAMRELRANPNLIEILKEEDESSDTIEDLIDMGFLGLTPLNLITE